MGDLLTQLKRRGTSVSTVVLGVTTYRATTSPMVGLGLPVHETCQQLQGELQFVVELGHACQVAVSPPTPPGHATCMPMTAGGCNRASTGC